MTKYQKYLAQDSDSSSRFSNPVYIAIAVTAGIVLLVWGLTAISGNSQETTIQPQTKTQSMDNHHGSKEASEMTFSSLLGKTAPDFTLENYDGKQVHLSELRGKRVVLFFTEGLMCYPACWNQMAAFAQDKSFNTDDVITLNITIDNRADWGQAIDKMPELRKATVLFDTNKTVSNTYGVLTLNSSMHRGEFPGHTYLILDKNGIVRFAKDDPQMAVRNNELKSELMKID